MAQLVIMAAGAVAGNALGWGILGMSGAAVGWTAGGLLANALIKQPGIEGPRLGDLRVSGSEYGQPIPWLAGAPRVAGQIAYSSAKRELSTTESSGKGGGQDVTSYTYEVDLLIVLSENETGGVARIWKNGDLVYVPSATATAYEVADLYPDAIPSSFGFTYATIKEGTWTAIRIYTGSDTQMPDPTYEAAVGADNAPAYRGRTYVFIEGLQLGNSGQIPNLTFELGISGVDLDSTGWLTQCVDTVGVTEIIAEVGNNGETYGTGFTSDAVNTFHGEPSIYGEWITPDAGTTGVPVAVASTNWRFEMFVKFTGGTNNTSDFFSIYPLGPGVGSFHVELSWGNGAFSILVANWSTTYSSGGGVVNGTMTRPNSTDWYHFAFQNDTTNKLFAVYLDGVYIWGHGGGGTQPWDAGTGLRVVFNDFAAKHNCGGACIRVNLPANELYGYPTINAVAFTPPTTRLTLLGTLTNVWYDNTLDPDGLRIACNDLLERAGYDADQYDNTDLQQAPLYGLALSQIAGTRSALELLQKAYFFTVSKSDTINLRERPSVSVATIPYEDLRVSEDWESEEQPLTLAFTDDLTIPGQVAVTYNNMNADYVAGTEYSDRLLGEQLTTESIQLGLGLIATKAKEVADRMLFDSVSSAVKTTIKVGLQYAYIEPGDPVDVVNAEGTTLTFRVEEKRDNLTIIELDLVFDDSGSLTSSSITDEGYENAGTVNQLSPSFWEAMDIPLLRDNDDSPGWYGAVAPNKAVSTDEWPGAVMVQSWDAVTFENKYTSGDACVMGSCTSTLGNFTGGTVYDEKNLLTVTVAGTLSSSTRAAMAADISVNMALVGDEIIRFRLATLTGTSNGENTYTLASLLRGQRGTEHEIAYHGSGERFVLLDTNIRNVSGTTAEIGVASTVKAVSLGLLLSSETAEAFTDTGIRLKPFAPVALRAIADGADIEITWHRRTRLNYRYGGALGGSFPLGETTESYTVTIYDGSVLIRTASVSTPSYTYSAANIASDGFVTSDTITIEVVQVSSAIGDGYLSLTTVLAP